MVALSSLASFVWSASSCGSLVGVSVVPSASSPSGSALVFVFGGALSARAFAARSSRRLGVPLSVRRSAAAGSGAFSWSVACWVEAPVACAAAVSVPVFAGGAPGAVVALVRRALGVVPAAAPVPAPVVAPAPVRRGRGRRAAA